MIIFKNVNKTYRSKSGNHYQALQNINLQLEEKGLIFLLGKSGSGKSTLLNVLGCLDTIDSGSIKVNGLEITSLKLEEYDSYRNSIIGFIFQEFNLLEHLNVYENISIGKELQEQKISLEEIDMLLKQLNLEGLGNRKINELSGGQKGRVAIARALIKNSPIILADEPTGNLDETTSEEIFKILKEISKEKLVLVVTHDFEAAEKFGSRIIRIKDGKIEEKDLSIPNETNKIALKKAKLSWHTILKLTQKNIRVKPFKLVMSIILLAFALTFIGITLTLFTYNEKEQVIDVMRKNNLQNYQIEKIEKTKEETNDIELNEQDLQKLETLTQNIANPVYKIINAGNPLSFELNTSEIKKEKNQFFYSNYQAPIIEYIEIKNNNMFPKLIGKLPESENEMIIHKHMAEKIIFYGIKDSNNEWYYPTSLEQLIKDHHPLKLENNTVYISGIIDDDQSAFQESLRKDRWYPKAIEQYFRKDYERNATKVYVKGMTSSLKIDNQNYTILNNLFIESYYQEQDLIPLQKEITIVTKNGSERKNKLNKDEIIISISLLKQMDETFKTDYQKFLSTEEETEENIYYFLTNYLQNKLSNMENIKINHNTNAFSTTIAEPKIIGISLDNHIYISDEFLTLYQDLNKKCTSVYFYETNPEKIKNTILNTTFTIPNASGTYFHFFMNFEGDIQDRTFALNSLKVYTAFICSILILFAFILCLNLINSSMISSKKEIGILKSLGTTSKDIQKIFQLEAIFISILSGLLGLLAFIITSIHLNSKIFSTMFYHFDILSIKIPVILSLLLTTLIFSMLITYYTSKNLTKVKPIDAIHNK